MSPLSESLLAQAERETSSLICPSCRERKESGKPFCVKCFRELPSDLRYALATSGGTDWAVAQDEAKELLRGGSRWKAD